MRRPRVFRKAVVLMLHIHFQLLSQLKYVGTCKSKEKSVEVRERKRKKRERVKERERVTVTGRERV